jgi:hypothetical protein
MVKNIGPTDRRVRFAAAAILVLLALFVVSGPLAWVLALVGVVLAATAAVGTCPIYLPFGFSTAGSGRPTLHPN